jgi:endoglucanase
MNQLYEPKIITGGYGDRKFTDEWFWAASELFTATGKKMYEDTIAKYVLSDYNLPSWSETGLLGYYCLIRTGNKGSGQKHIDSIRTIDTHGRQIYPVCIHKCFSNSHGWPQIGFRLGE